MHSQNHAQSRRSVIALMAAGSAISAMPALAETSSRSARLVATPGAPILLSSQSRLQTTQDRHRGSSRGNAIFGNHDMSVDKANYRSHHLRSEYSAGFKMGSGQATDQHMHEGQAQ